MPSTATAVPGFRGEISEIEVLPDGEPALGRGPDLVAMARSSLGYLSRNPDPNHSHDARFTLLPHLCPPFAPEVTAGLFTSDARRRYEQIPHIDPVAIGDTESRNDVAANLMREMAGATDEDKALDAVHERLVGYIRGDGDRVGDDLCWCRPCSLFAADDDEPYAMVWTSAMLLRSEADLFRLTGEDGHRDLARRLFQGLQRVARWDGERAWYPHGVAPFRHTFTSPGAYPGHYPNVIAPVLAYWRACGDAEAPAFARAMAEGLVANLQPNHLHWDDGHVGGHSHLQMHAVRGVAQLGALTGTVHFLDWSERAYERNHRASLDTGWIPEHHWHREHRSHSETCLVADMLETAAWLARGGRPHLWDRVERSVRNYLAPAQFAVTDAFVDFWSTLHRDRSEAERAVGLAQLRELEGGFLGGMTPTDWVVAAGSLPPHHGMLPHDGDHLMVEMPGCCPPSAMRALHCAWQNTVVDTPQGVVVNLAFSRDAPEARVASHMPGRGRLEVEVEKDVDFWLRPPAWAPRDRVKLWRDGRETHVEWGGPAEAYVACPGAARNEALTLEWPLLRFEQRLVREVASVWEDGPARYEPADTHTFTWIGNSVLSIEPAARWLPWYPHH